MHSCLYLGYLQHRRLTPVEHAFRYGLYLAYLDLDELPDLLACGYGLSRARFSAASFLRRDHFGDPQVPLPEAVREIVAQQTGSRPTGPIRLLTLLRNWGHYFCPLSLYYCFDPTGQTVDTVVAEVSNNPWHERHLYVLGSGNRIDGAPEFRFHHPKSFHVSPFMGMDMDYDWRLVEPRPTLTATIVNMRGDERLFEASLVLHRRELGRGTMFRTLLQHPWMTARVVQAIYWQALRLWWKKCPYYPHPRPGQTSEGQQQ
jgi:hypothetical protein